MTRNNASSMLGTHRKNRLVIITLTLDPTNQIQMDPSRERGLKSEVVMPLYAECDFAQHQPARTKSCCLGQERGDASGDQVGVDEISAVGIVRQKLARKGGLSRAVWSRDDICVWVHQSSGLTKQTAPLKEWQSENLLMAVWPTAVGRARRGGTFPWCRQARALCRGRSPSAAPRLRRGTAVCRCAPGARRCRRQ